MYRSCLSQHHRQLQVNDRFFNVICISFRFNQLQCRQQMRQLQVRYMNNSLVCSARLNSVIRSAANERTNARFFLSFVQHLHLVLNTRFRLEVPAGATLAPTPAPPTAAPTPQPTPQPRSFEKKTHSCFTRCSLCSFVVLPYRQRRHSRLRPCRSARRWRRRRRRPIPTVRVVQTHDSFAYFCCVTSCWYRLIVHYCATQIRLWRAM